MTALCGISIPWQRQYQSSGCLLKKSRKGAVGMALVDRLREIMEKEFGIKTDADLLKAIEEYPDIDLGIFASPVMEDFGHAV